MPAVAATTTAIGGGGNGHDVSSSSLPTLRLPTSPRGGGGAPLKPMASNRTLTTADVERTRRLIRSVPLLKQLLRDQHCTEEQLLNALRLTSFADGEYIYSEGQAERDLYFIEDGKVLITQRRAASATDTGGGGSTIATVVGAIKGDTRRSPSVSDSVSDAMLQIQIHTLHAHEYFGELALLQHAAVRKSNAIATGAVVCFVMLEHDAASLLRPLHALMLYRHLLRVHGVLENDRLFKEWTPLQRQCLIDGCILHAFSDTEVICRQGEIDDRYFVLVEGEADVVMEESSFLEDSTTNSTVVARKSIFQSFGEMGLLDKPRTATVLAVGVSVLCVVITRTQYITAAQLGATSAIDVDAEALLATTLMEEWNLVINARNLHLSNPKVAHYLVTFIKHFKAAYNQKFAGKTLYLDLFRRLHREPSLADEFPFVAMRITWDSPASSLGIIRSETRRVLTKESAARTPGEVAFIGRLIEHTSFISKFDVPGPHIDRPRLARCLARFVAFANIAKDAYLFRQGKIESRAFMILRGKINIVNEDVGTTSTSTTTTVIKHHEVIATLSAGDSFGELSLVTRLQRSATTMAACDTDLLVFDRDHLQAVEAALPGVSVQQLMVKRAEFLARLSFFRGSDFGQCIRVAHDLQHVVYEARHLFLQESMHQRTLYIVRSGEIGVFMKIKLPVASHTQSPPVASNPVTISSSSSGGPTSVPLIPPTATTKTALVRVATICAQEFFGIAIATANPGGVTPTTGLPLVTPAVTIAHVLQAKGEQWDLGAAVYMSTTRVEMLELSERGWRRLSPQCLVIVRNSLLERHKWNEAMATKQQTQQSPPSLTSTSGVATVYYQLEKPWQPLTGHATGPSGGPTGESMHLSSPTTGGRAHSQLARHVYERQSFQSPFATLASPAETLASDASPPKTSESRASGATPLTKSPPAVSVSVSPSVSVSASWGWRSPFSSTPPPPSSSPSPFHSSPIRSNRPSYALSPLVSFAPPTAASSGPPVGFSLLPRPPLGDRSPLLTSANLSPRSTMQQQAIAAAKERDTAKEKAKQAASTNLWKARSPLARRTEYQA